MRLVKGNHFQCLSKYMLDNQPLLIQLANRCRKWHDQTGITQSQMAEAIGMADSNYSAFLSGRKGIGSESTCLLLQLTALPRRQAVARFSKAMRSSRIMELQEKGQAMYFDDPGWLPREGTSGDPLGSTDITSIRKAGTATSIADLVAVLGQLDNVTRKTVIDAIVRAYPNPNSTTPNNGQRFSR
jgi:transcriptional regulator with XRE-family HTH domain